jgi:hypothetical protein
MVTAWILVRRRSREQNEVHEMEKSLHSPGHDFGSQVEESHEIGGTEKVELEAVIGNELLEESKVELPCEPVELSTERIPN